MKKLVMILLLATACTPVEPKFHKERRVKYKVDSFYTDVCSGYGKVKNYGKVWNAFGTTIIYEIMSPAGEPYCPDSLSIEESDLSAIKE